MNELKSLLELLSMLLMDPRTGALIAMLVLASAIDLYAYRIPNWLTATGTLFALAYNSFAPAVPQAGLLWSIEGMAVGFMVMFPMYLLRVMGAGDVKLMAMCGAFLGIDSILYAVLWTFIAGGIAAVSYALFRRALGRMLVNIRDITQVAMYATFGGMRPDLKVDSNVSVGRLPYGVSIAVGTIGWMVARQLGYLQL